MNEIKEVLMTIEGRSILNGERPRFWHCDHNSSEVRMRINANGARCFLRQCLRCGRAVEAIGKPKAPATAPPWNAAIEERFRAETQRLEREWDETRNREWWAWYDRYLKTAEWRDRAERVMRRAGRMCEGCGKNPAVQVHHTTYEHVGNELLWELRAICLQCHHRVHPDKDTER